MELLWASSTRSSLEWPSSLTDVRLRAEFDMSEKVASGPFQGLPDLRLQGFGNMEAPRSATDQARIEGIRHHLILRTRGPLLLGS